MNTPRQGPDGGNRTLQADRLVPSGVQAHGSTAIALSLALEKYKWLYQDLRPLRDLMSVFVFRFDNNLTVWEYFGMDFNGDVLSLNDCQDEDYQKLPKFVKDNDF